MLCFVCQFLLSTVLGGAIVGSRRSVCTKLSTKKKMYGAVAFVVSVALLSQSVSAYTDAALADKITHLPGAEKLDITFNQFSGYLAVPGNSGNSKNMHYWSVTF